MALLHCHFHSEVLEIAASMDVLLPQTACREGTERLPVLYLLHGLSDDHSIWQRRTSIERYVDPLKLAVVMPAVNRSFYTDMVHGARYWTFISEEVPALAQAFFPISGQRSHSFVAGLSMGGFGAFKLALNCPTRFAAAASLSGALDMVHLAATMDEDIRDMRDCFGTPEQLVGSSNDLPHVATQLVAGAAPTSPPPPSPQAVPTEALPGAHQETPDRQAPQAEVLPPPHQAPQSEALSRPCATPQLNQVPRLYQWCGTEDFLYENNIRFRDHLRQLGMDLTYAEGPGGHEWACWDAQIQRVLEWLPLPAGVVS